MFIDFNGEKTSEAAVDNVANARRFFARPEITERITELAVSTCGWMIKNENKTQKNGDEVTGAPWWPQLSDTTDDDRLDLRRHSLRTLTFGHGLRRLLNQMVGTRLISPTMKDYIDDATEYQYMEVHYQLMGFSRSENPERTVSLTYIRDAFNLSEKTSPTKVRDGSLGQMALLGLWEAQYDGQVSHIKAGATAKIFHEKIFTPVRQHFEKTLRGGIASLAAGLALLAVGFVTLSAVTHAVPVSHAVVSSETSPVPDRYAYHPSDHIPT